ncbi:MAG: O-antigen ligase family protein [Bacteroidota bacterium]|nr:O-antigen ligase family protein [Bacteroidota bacterium]
MRRAEIHTRIHLYLAMLIAFFLPVSRFVPLFIGLMMLNWLVEGDFGSKFKTFTRNKFALLFSGFYFLHLIGLAYTENMDSGMFDVQVKLSLLVFPLLLSSRPFDQTSVNRIFFALITGGVLTSLIMLSRATYIYSSTGENNFFYEPFSAFLIHPGYLSMYLNIAIVFILINVLRNVSLQRFLPDWLCIVLIIFFSFIIVLLSSKLGLITLILIFFVFMAYTVISRKKYVLGIAGLLLLLLSLAGIMKFVPGTADRVNNAIKALTTPAENSNDAESTAVRMNIWKAANSVIAENFLIGTGTGDPKDELIKEYERRGMIAAAEHKLNAHNEFYQVFVSLGLIGFIVFCLHLFLPLIRSFRTGYLLYGVFLLILILNFLTESMLEAQAGVIFFAFFNSVLCFTNPKTKEKFKS